jgi:hypothetical protein
VKGLSEKPASGGQMVAETRVTPLIAFGRIPAVGDDAGAQKKA